MLTDLAIILILGLIGSYIFRLLKLPPLIGMMIMGILAGPYAFNILKGGILDVSGDLRQFALIIILTRAGLTLDIKDLKNVGRSALLLCFVPACFEICGALIIAPRLLDVTPVEAGLIGTVIAAVSPAVVVPRMIKLIEEKYGVKKGIPQMILAGASVDDIFVIVLFTALLTAASGGSISPSLFAKIPVSIILGIILGIAVGVVLDQLFKRIKGNTVIKVMIMLGTSFLLAALEDILDNIPISGLIAVMTLGIIINKVNIYEAKELSKVYNGLWSFGEIVLFVLVGAAVDISYALGAGVAAIAIVIFALIFRMCGVFTSVLGTGLSKKEKLFTMLAYTPKATVQAAIGSLPLSMGLSCGNTVLTVAVLAILITAPFGAICIDRSYKHLLCKN